MEYKHLYDLFENKIELTTNSESVDNKANLFLGAHEMDHLVAPDYKLIFDESPTASDYHYPDHKLRSDQDYLIFEENNFIFLFTREGNARFDPQKRICFAHITQQIHSQNNIESVPILNLAVVMSMFLTGFLPLHAAAVLHNGRLVVLAGEKKAGKSTLALKLHEQGMPLICDDLLYVKKENDCLVAGGHLQPIKILEEDTTHLFDSYQETEGAVKIPGKKLYPIEHLNPYAGNRLYPVEAIIFLQHQTIRDDSAQIWSDRQADVIYHLVGDAPMLNTLEYRDRTLDLVCGAESCQLFLARTSVHPEDTVKNIFQALKHSSTPLFPIRTKSSKNCILPWDKTQNPLLRSWQTFSSGQTAGICSPNLDLDIWQPWLERLPGALATSSATEISYLSLLSTGRRTYRMIGPDGVPLFIKRYPNASLIRLPSPDGLSFGNHPWDAFCRNFELWQKTIPVPEPLAFFETTSEKSETACYTVTRLLEGCHSLLDFTFEHLCCKPVASARLRRWVHTIMSSIIDLHRLGYSHGDLHQLNIMVQCVNSTNNLKIFFTDFDMCRHGNESPPYSEQLLDLATLGVSFYGMLPDRLIAKGLILYLAAFEMQSTRREECIVTIKKKYRHILEKAHQSNKSVEDFYFDAALTSLDKKSRLS